MNTSPVSVRSSVRAAVSAALALSAATTAFGQSSDELTEVVVTGSRIVRRDLTSASPIVTVSSEALANTAQVGLEAQLNKLPQFAPGNNQFGGSGDVQASPTNSPGAATLNLRGLGANRSLVLVDGRRAQPFNATLAIDLNSIPSAAIESVEVITGGAAAVYGADAVAGVVNFKLKRNFKGVEFDGQWGETGEGDARQFQASMLVGASLDSDRGNVMVGVNYAKRDPAYQKDRSFYTKAWTDPLTNGDIFLPIPQFSITDTTGFVQNAPSQAAVDCVFAGVGAGCPFPAKQYSTGGAVRAGEVRGASPGATNLANLYGVNTDGTVFFPGTSATSRAVGYNGPLAPEFKILGTAGTSNNGLVHNNTTAQFSLPLERYSLFGNAFYDVNDSITAFAQGNYTHTTTTSVGGYPPASIAWSAMIPYNSNASAIDPATVGFNPFLLPGQPQPTLPQYIPLGCAPTGGCTYGQSHPVPAQLKYLLDSRANPNAPWDLNMELKYLGPTSITNTTNTYQMTAGFRGKIAPIAFLQDWTWEAYASHGDTEILTDYSSGFVNTVAYQTLVAQPFFGAGYSNANNFLGRSATCTSGLPVFTQSTPSSDCLDIIAARMKGTTTIAQDVFEGFVQGGIVDLPGGQLRGVVGADYRHDRFAFKPDSTMTNSNILSSASGVFDVAPTSGATWVKEAYSELLVPIVKGLPAVKALGLELGARYSDYNTAGTVDTYKALVTWETLDWLTFRGGYQLANRAPNVAELFQAASTIVTVVPTFDPCDATVTTAPYGNIASNPNRAKVQALCSALAGGVPVGDNFQGLGAFSSIALDTQAGNPNLESESATTWTGGVVLRAPWDNPLVNRLTATVDWYSVKIAKAISGLTTASVYEQCLNGTGSNPTYDVNNAFCKLIHRDNLFGFPAGVSGTYTNIGAIKTSGIDLQLNWAANLNDMGIPAPGLLSLDVAVNHLNSYEIQNSPGASFIEYAGTTGNGTSGSQFKNKYYTTFGYTVGPVSTRLSWRHLPELASTVPNTLPNAKHDELDLSALWNVTEGFTLRAGVENLTDAEPEIVGRIPGVNNAYGTTDPGYYDVLGRRYYIGASAKF